MKAYSMSFVESEQLFAFVGYYRILNLTNSQKTKKEGKNSNRNFFIIVFFHSSTFDDATLTSSLLSFVEGKKMNKNETV